MENSRSSENSQIRRVTKVDKRNKEHWTGKRLAFQCSERAERALGILGAHFDQLVSTELQSTGCSVLCYRTSGV